MAEIELDITQQAANKLAGLCPFCASDTDHLNLHNLGCPKLKAISKMSDWGEWDGKWPRWGDEMVRAYYIHDHYGAGKYSNS